NAGGEKSLTYGKTDKYVRQVKVVLADGKEHVFSPLDKNQLHEKMNEHNFEGSLYRKMYDLITKNSKRIRESRINVSKNSTGYNIWDVWDGKTFDMTKVIVGSQGTLGLLTEVRFKLVPSKPLSG